MANVHSQWFLLVASTHSAIKSTFDFFSILKVNVSLFQIVSLAIVFACFCRKSNNDQEVYELLDDDHVELKADEEYLHSTKVYLSTSSSILIPLHVVLEAISIHSSISNSYSSFK